MVEGASGNCLGAHHIYILYQTNLTLSRRGTKMGKAMKEREVDIHGPDGYYSRGH